MIKTLLIDFDNTLHNSDPKFVAAFDGVLGLSGKELWEIYLIKIHRGIVHKRFPERHEDVEFHCKLIFELLGKPYDESIARQIARRYREAEEGCWREPKFFPDTFVFLNRVKERMYKICLSTGGNAREKARCLEKFGSKRYFDHVFGEDTIGYGKTDPNYYKNALRLSNSAPKETVSIGDTLTHDIRPAKSLGIKTIWVNRKGEDAPSNDYWKPDYEVEDLTKALNYLIQQGKSPSLQRNTSQ